jgi:predicted DNA-binding transcriptional regulator AlpA
MLWVANPDPSTWVRKGPGAVLSFWRGLKRQMWEEFYARGIDPELLPPPKTPYVVKHTRPLLSVIEVARLLDMSDEQVLWTIGHGKFPGAIRGGGLWRSWLIPRSDVSALLPA